jgi:hypothetical protein
MREGIGLERGWRLRALAADPREALHGLRWVLGLLLGALVLGVATAVQPVLALAAVAFVLVVVWTTAQPVRAAYLLVLVVPLVVGMSRGLIVPFLRPNELLVLLLLGLAILRATFGPSDGQIRLGPLTAVDRAFGVLFVFGSLVPLATLLYRGGVPSAEDGQQLLSLLKYYVGYRLVLALVPGEREMLIVARVMVAASVIVAFIGLLQIERVFEIHEWLATYFSAGQVREALEHRRATSTLGVWQALGVYLSVHAALAAALLATATPRGAWRWLLAGALVVDVLGALATTTLTAVLALAIALGLVALFTRRVGRTIVLAAPVLVIALLIFQTVIQERVNYQYHSWGASGEMPVTWEYRIYNLTKVFWPQVQDNLLFGVAPSVSQELTWQFPENQVMYLLYQGGLLYVAAYLLFIGVVLRCTWRYLQRLQGPGLAVARTAFIAWVLILVLGLLDPHLTMAGEADAAWALLALATGAATRGGGG